MLASPGRFLDNRADGFRGAFVEPTIRDCLFVCYDLGFPAALMATIDKLVVLNFSQTEHGLLSGLPQLIDTSLRSLLDLGNGSDVGGTNVTRFRLLEMISGRFEIQRNRSAVRDQKKDRRSSIAVASADSGVLRLTIQAASAYRPLAYARRALISWSEAM